MSNEEIAVQLAAALLAPAVALPARRANIQDNAEMLQNAAELAVHLYRTVLQVLEQPQSQ
jgi:hypothetical protein